MSKIRSWTGETLHPTDTITPPPEFCGEETTRFQNLIGAADDADWIPFTPVQGGVAEDLIEPPVLGQKVGYKLVVERLDILDIGAFQPVSLGLVDLPHWPSMRFEHVYVERTMVPTML